MFRTVSAAAVLAAVAIAAASPADARIVCRGNFQVVQGNEIATPYCQDNYLAVVAREYGMRVSEAEIRNNPNRKREVCQFVGRDIRVQLTCVDANSQGRRGF